MEPPHPVWHISERVLRVPPLRRGAVLAEFTEAVGHALSRLGADRALGFLWTPVGIPATKLARAKGFWKAWRGVGESLPAQAKRAEWALSRADGLHFLGRVEVPVTDLPALIDAMHRYERNCGCVVVPLGDALPATAHERIVAALSTARFEKDLVSQLCGAAQEWHATVMVPFGRFDDAEVGLMIAGPFGHVDNAIG
jgi:hypothetical protein